MKPPENSQLTVPALAPQRTISKLLVLLILAGGIAYSNSLTKPFLLDDITWISGTDKIKNLQEYVLAMRSRPVAAVTLYLNYRLHGLNVFGYHLVNVAIHLAAALTLFGLVRRTLLLPRWDGRFAGSAPGLAFAVALLWTVHPLQTQAVTYVIQRHESLMGLFYLLTLYCLARATQSAHSWRWYVLSWFCCGIGAGCKEVMVTIVPIMLCYDRIFVASWKEMVRQRWWYYLGIFAIWGVPLLAALPFLLERSADSSAGFGIPNLPPHVYWMTQGWVILHYLQLLFVPYPQGFSYRGWPFTTEFADFWPAGLAIGLMLLATCWLVLRRHWIGFLGVWFFGILSITSIIPLLDVAFEHRLYLPLAAFSALMVFGTYAGLMRLGGARLSRRLGIPMLVVASVALAGLTMHRNNDYQNTRSMWITVHELFPNDPDALNNLAVGLEQDGNFDEAKAYYEKCLQILPGMYLPKFSLGQLLCRQDQPAAGLPHMLLSLKMAETIPYREDWRGSAHYRVGKFYWILGDMKSAEDHFRQAIHLAPKKGEYYGALGFVLEEQNQRDQGSAYLAQGLELNPALPRFAEKQAVYYLHRFRAPTDWTRKEALFYAALAARATANKDLSIVNLLAETYAANRRYDEAIRVSQEALQRMDLATAPEQRHELLRTIASFQNRRQSRTDAGKPK